MKNENHIEKKDCSAGTGVRNKYPAYCLLLIEAVIQIAGGIFYDQTPQEVWALSNAILFMFPLAFGIRFGLLCLIPVAVSEIVWFCILLKAGPLLHLFSFAVTIIVLGLAGEKLKRSPTPRRVTGSCILYELSLLGEETLYYGLRMLFLNRPFTWADVSGSFLSWANPLMLLLLVYCIVKERSSAGEG